MKKNDSEIAKRYAVALYEIALENGQLLAYLDSFRVLQSLCTKNVVEMLTSPIYSDDEKSSLLQEIILLSRSTDVVAHFFKVVFYNKRISILELVFQSFSELVDSSMDVKRAEVVSARPLPVEELDLLEKTLSEASKKKVFLLPKIDESLKAGFVINLKNKTIDSSLKTKLKNLKEILATN